MSSGISSKCGILCRGSNEYSNIPLMLGAAKLASSATCYGQQHVSCVTDQQPAVCRLRVAYQSHVCGPWHFPNTSTLCFPVRMKDNFWAIWWTLHACKHYFKFEWDLCILCGKALCFGNFTVRGVRNAWSGKHHSLPYSVLSVLW
jgi:hypothetical protein